MSIFRNAINAVLACLLFIAVSNLAEDHSIFDGKQINAERFTVVERGGYFPVLTQLDNKDLVAVCEVEIATLA